MPGDTERRIAACTRVTDDKTSARRSTRPGPQQPRPRPRGKGDVKGAMADYDEAIRLDPRSANAAAVPRQPVPQRRQPSTAPSRDLSEAIRIDPGVALFYNRRGISYYARNDYERAIADFTESLRLSPNNIDAIWAAARPHAYAGYRARAISRLQPKRSGSSRTRPAAMAPAHRCTSPRATMTLPSPTSTNSYDSIRRD
jgi:tetratricopeptide (TPR) repeat protein